MINLLPDRIPWYIVGPSMGLCVAALYALANRRLGVSGSYLQVFAFLRGHPSAEMWRVWFFVGLGAGALVAATLRGGPALTLTYGALGLLLPLGVLISLLFVAGVLIGYGSRWAGGCTSGHGIGGTSALAPDSIVATLVFCLSALLVTFLLHLASGGVL
jgi:uncharacterized membrane protein YedE/YeeE